jgi:hypothetical protein
MHQSSRPLPVTAMKMLSLLKLTVSEEQEEGGLRETSSTFKPDELEL